MNKKNKGKFIQFVLAFLLSCFLAGNALACVTVSDPVIDCTTQGNWPGIYGECFFLLPNPNLDQTEEPVGPDPYGQLPGQYQSTCSGGSLLDSGQIDWRIFRTVPAGVQAPANAFAWSMPAALNGSQWNPCLNKFRTTTWDDDDPAFDPLVAELKLNFTGSLTLSYYFVNAENVCRFETFNLYVNGELKKSGTVGDFESGKYVVFSLEGLEGETLIRMEVTLSGTERCAAAPIQGLTSHISGVFIDDCLEGCTPGYWKQCQHFGSWPSPYRPSTLFSSVFDNAFPRKTLLQVLNSGGGGLNALGRHTVAALLNASSADVDYGLTPSEVIQLFNGVYPGRDRAYERLKNYFESLNQMGCPLGRNTN